MSKKWWIEVGVSGEVVLSSRVRLARNFAKFPFPSVKSDYSNDVSKEVENALSRGSVNFKRIDMGKTDTASRMFLAEKHLISPALAKNDNGTAFLSEAEDVCVMANEEDHIRIQAMTAGFELDKAYKAASLTDKLIEEQVNYAFSEKYGFITSCPTNIGTGMRASVMLHLPALCMTGNINRVIGSVSKFGIAVRGLYGEGSEATGNIFQISNQITLGISEAETISNLKSVTEGIIESELEARNRLSDRNIIKLADRVWRSYGILKNAQILTSDEFMKLSSDVRLGVNMGIIGNVDIEKLNELTATVQPAGITKAAGKELSPEQRDFERAKAVREKL